MQFQRTILTKIEKNLFKGKIIILYGPRRVGKTTLVTKIKNAYSARKKTLYLLGDDITVQHNLSSQNAALLKQYLGDAELVVIDEAQRIKNIGINLKILTDTHPEIQIIATGSSSFDLANEISEPLTGRKWEYFLPPLTIHELTQTYSRPQLYGLLNNLINFGLYPEIITSSGMEVQPKLESIAKDYLFKDVLAFEGQKNSEFVFRLLQLLAFQIGNEVSYNELAAKLGVSKGFLEKYIHLLEETFVIFRLGPFSRNLRKEVGKKRKIYFWDTGIRNALIQNFNDLSLRQDAGQLWENFCISERKKMLKVNQQFANQYYWRTYDKKEIDYIEESGGKLDGYEMKWGDGKLKKHEDFLSAYTDSSLTLINRDSFWDFVTV
ncbi:ATPase [Candidatus Peregrinibacteria bacterium CG11_big_fil_rev_8_21_14_0_20_46_8]|nr:MAG: ATPase [Candidatus Peregrinibacteria bacterium CG11_big_fil_rev_8_21_14_0_20_46_8]